MRAERIGFQTVTSRPLELAAGEPLFLQLETSEQAIELEEIRVEAERRCRVLPETGVALARIWEEARKALANQKWATQRRIFPFRILRYERAYDVSGTKVLSETRQERNVVAPTAIRSRPALDLHRNGFIQVAEGDDQQYEYFGPDAEVLLSDLFLDQHCFRLVIDQLPQGKIGLAFEPLESGGVPDIEGTLWLDAETARLTSLEFGYNWAPHTEARGLARGLVEFEALPSGAWIIPTWWIRTPNLELEWGLRAQPNLRVLGYTETGEEISSLADMGMMEPSGSMATLAGRVWDSIQNRPLPGATVYLSGTGHGTTTDSLGRFELMDIREGVFSAVVTHPLLDSLGVFPPGTEVSLQAGSRVEVALALPSMASLVEEVCRGQGWEQGMAAVVGYVRDSETGNPIPRAGATFEWTDFRTVGGREIAADVRSVEVSTDGRGRYEACVLSSGADIMARAAVGESKGRIKELQLSASTISLVDLTVTPASSPSVRLEGVNCRPGEVHPGQGALGGRVLDSNTGVPIGMVGTWAISEETGEAEYQEADGGGRFLFCPLAPGDYILRAVFRGFGETQTPVSIGANQRTTQNLQLFLQDAGMSSGEVRGKVLANEDQRPLSGATVALEELGQMRITADDGSFSFPRVPVGAVTLTVSFLGFEDSKGGVVVGGGQTLDLVVHLATQPIEMEPIVVEATRVRVDGLLADVQRRADRGWGTVLLEEDLRHRRTVSRTSDILQEYGATVVGSSVGQQALYFQRTLCAPVVYLDGIRVAKGSGRKAPLGGGGGVASAAAVNLVHPTNVAAIEIYRGPAQTPGEFLDSNSQCGVILIWTKRGG